MTTALSDLSNDLAGVAHAAGQSLVRVQRGPHRFGSGPVWHPEGLVITNAHVVGPGPVDVELPDGSRVAARLLAKDDHLNLAALVIEASGLPAIELGSAKELRPGSWVMALGHPWGVPGAVTAGVVIGLERIAPGEREMLAVALRLRPRDSGGALVDANGRLVGVNAVMAGPDVGMAIPVHVVTRFLRQTLGRR